MLWGQKLPSGKIAEMRLLRRHKYILIALAVYWPLVFTLTLIPVPDIARRSGMSDKTMHVMAYFALTFLVWCAVSPYHCIQWNRAKAWWVLGALTLYGAVNEYLQGFVGRSACVEDFIANLFGIVFAMGVMSIFHFWPALLIAGLGSVFVVSNLSNLTALYPQYHFNTVFHFIAYAGLTLIWIQHIERYLHLRRNRTAWLLAATALPVAMLGLVWVTAPLYDKTVWVTDAATAVFGIIAAVLTSRLTFAVTQKINPPHENRPEKP